MPNSAFLRPPSPTGSFRKHLRSQIYDNCASDRQPRPFTKTATGPPTSPSSSPPPTVALVLTASPAPPLPLSSPPSSASIWTTLI
ncbi:hypothetical protein NL676_025845 [Syzygium grande]|nr:hypothetical protein NL676_025845 [Syzygium grande]